ncbi:hypothetical protein [uncultured Fibrobacter sp.]|uniref:hypothetical protein n=1 Tax=uncultured Fibrobacter sp. TaxID=261512 RepID=UPI0025D6AA8C|nr:hypothetical protein [uncultured Fibrobacter sp.]
MNFNMKIKTIALISSFMFSADFALAENQDSIVSQQKSLLETLDSLNDAVLGLRVNGTAKAGGLTSIAESDNFSDESATQENQAFTDVDLKFGANPSAETHIDVRMRLHKDWQSAYDVNNNPVIGHWFSYDGLILNKHLSFNLGYMRVGYSPLTISTPQPDLLQEPEILASHRVEALARRNLDTTDRRLLHGLNAEYNSGKIGAVDNVAMQITGARLRNISKKSDQVFFDFDFSDRYLFASRLGVDLMGVHLGGDIYNVADRKLTTRAHTLDKYDTTYYEFDRVISAELGFASKPLMPSLPLEFGFDGEYAMSNWRMDRDYQSSKKVRTYVLASGQDPKVPADSFVYYKPLDQDSNFIFSEKYADDDGKSFYVEPFIRGEAANVEYNLKVRYLQTDEKFWSEMAATPSYRGGAVVLNANALYKSVGDSMIVANFGSSSLENLYFNVYNAVTLNATNLITSHSSSALSAKDESEYLYSRLYNNYKDGHFYRNGYSASILKRSEISSDMFALDPTVSLAMPYGDVTPDRKGVKTSLDVNWNDILTFNARFDMLTQPHSSKISIDAAGTPSIVIEENKYTRYAAGLGFDAGQLLSMDRKILIQGSYDHSEESANYNRKADRIMGGFTVDVYGPISFLGSVQMFNKEFGETGYAIADGLAYVMDTKEMLTLEGIRVKIAPASYLDLQGGYLKNEITYKAMDVNGAMQQSKLSVGKIVASADVTVNF